MNDNRERPAIVDKTAEDALWCPRCGQIFHDADVRDNPSNYVICPICGAVEHAKCRGPAIEPSESARELVQKIRRMKNERREYCQWVDDGVPELSYDDAAALIEADRARVKAEELRKATEKLWPLSVFNVNGVRVVNLEKAIAAISAN